MTQPNYADGDWETSSKFAYEPDEVLLQGQVKVISTANDLIAHLGENVNVNWPLVIAGLRRKRLIEG